MRRFFQSTKRVVTAAAVLTQLTMVMPAYAQAFGSFGSLELTACGSPISLMAGGSGTRNARAQRDASGDCAPDETAKIGAAAIADIASGHAFVSANVAGPIESVRAIARSNYTDLVRVDNVPSDIDSVTVRATIELIVSAESFVAGSSEFLFGRITVPGGGDLELRRCNPDLCPDDPIAADFISQDYQVTRNSNTGNFPLIGVAANAVIDVAEGAGFFVSRTSIEVIDDSGGTISSFSEVYASQPNVDGDMDGVVDAIDNCRLADNVDQRDTDADGFGNRCDPDLNNDLIVNVIDLGGLRTAFFTADADADFNGDGVVNVTDLGILRSYFFAAPGP